jgi:hypothetical protein
MAKDKDIKPWLSKLDLLTGRNMYFSISSEVLVQMKEMENPS